MFLDEPIVPKSEMFYNYQRYYLFHLLENSGIEYDKVLTVDADTLVHPNAPNIFEHVDDRLHFVHDNGSYDWIIRGMEWYGNELFDGLTFPFYEYGNSGFQILNKKHKPFYDEMLKLFTENKEVIIQMSERYGLGKEQALWNLMIRKHNIDYNILPYQWNMTNMKQKECLDGFLATQLGFVYHFNGLDGKEMGFVSDAMEKYMEFLHGNIKE